MIRFAYGRGANVNVQYYNIDDVKNRTIHTISK